jgi:hypothetical protein
MTASATAELGGATLGGLIDNSATQDALAAHLDGLGAEERVRQCRELSGKQMRRLWQAVAGAPAFGLEHLVPPSIPDGQTVIWAGKNSLPLFSIFEKRFARQGGAVVGYNYQSMSWFSGPGYFTVVPAPREPKELLFDYTRVPDVAPPGWPAIRPNERGGSWLVYRNMHDFCRRVSGDLIIGSATRLGKEMDSYFVLARAT